MLDGLGPLLVTSRCFGFHPFTIGKNTSSTWILRLYSSLLGLVYLVLLILLILQTACPAMDVTSITCTIMRLPTPLYFLSLSASAFATMLNHDGLRLADIRARSFDEFVHYRPTVRPVVPWIAVFLPLAVWGAFYAIVDIYYPMIVQKLLNGLLVRYLMALEITKFHLLLDSYRKRFRRLNQLTKDGVLTVKNGKSTFTKATTVQDVYAYYACLEKGVRLLNSFFAIHLFMWLCTIMLEVISFAYLLIVFSSESFVFRELFAVIYAVLIVFITVRICHLTSSEANQFGRTLFSLESKMYQRAKFTQLQDLVECGLFVYKRPVRVMVADMFPADYPTLVTIVGCSVQYLIILFQFS